MVIPLLSVVYNVIHFCKRIWPILKNHWDEMKRKGEFVPSGREDVLVKATGKFDRPGYVRGIGGCVGLTGFFGKSKGTEVNKKVYTEEDFRLFQEELKKSQMVEVQNLVKQQVAEALKGHHLESKSSNDNEMTNTTDVSAKLNDDFLELKDPVPCCLEAYLDGMKKVVAEGTVWPWTKGQMVHNRPLTSQNVRVSIDNIKDGKALLPIPWDEYERIGEVMGSFTQWPKSLVLLGTEEDDLNSGDKAQQTKTTWGTINSPKPSGGGGGSKEHQVDQEVKSTKNKNKPLNDDELARLNIHCHRLEDMICYASGNYEHFTIEISNLVYSHESPITLTIMHSDIREMFRYEWLNISILQLWGSFLHNFGTKRGVTEELVGFLCPERLCTYMHSSVVMERYVTDSLKKHEKKRYMMGACLEASHWMLIVFCVQDCTAYIFDSDKATNKTWKIKDSLSWAWKRYTYKGGERDMSKKRELQINMIKCPQQPGSFECGYYVMKWMYDITMLYASSEKNLEECFSGTEVGKEMITDKEMNEVRELWALYCSNNI